MKDAGNGAIRAVVFDIGWVLLHLDYSRLTRFLREHGAAVADMRELVARIELVRHETGQLPGDGFLANVAGLASRSVDLAALRAAFELFGYDRGARRAGS